MAIFSASIIQSADDAYQDGTTVNLTSATPTINATSKYIGVRFQNVAVLPGSTIDAATLDLYLPSLANDDPDVDIWGHDTDDAGAFTTMNSDISGRTATTAVVQWTASSVGSGWKSSPDISTIVQEIIDRGGWSDGNDIVVILKGRSSSALRFENYDGGSGTYPTINITYTLPSGGTIVPQVMHHLGQQGIS